MIGVKEFIIWAGRRTMCMFGIHVPTTWPWLPHVNECKYCDWQECTGLPIVDPDSKLKDD